MTPILPAALQAGIARLVETVPPRDLATRAAELSDAYRANADTSAALRGDAAVAAYLATRMPATYAASASALGHVLRHAPEFAPRALLDAGCGPGTASWAAAEAWPSLQSITMLDRDQRLLAAAAALAQASDTVALRDAQMTRGALGTLDRSTRYDAVLASYAIAEQPDATLPEIVSALWAVCTGVLVIVEPGTPAGFARILVARDRLLAEGAQIVAPCPHEAACPMRAPDWCHAAVRLPRSRAHMRAKTARVPFEDEKFAYIAVAREAVRVQPAVARIVAPPHVATPAVGLRLCTNGVIEERSVPRDRATYKTARKAAWGDPL